MGIFDRKKKVAIDDERFKTLSLLDSIPINVTIRRIAPKQSGNEWSAQYLKGTIYYGQTLREALHKLTQRDKKVVAKIEKETNFIEDISNEQSTR